MNERFFNQQRDAIREGVALQLGLDGGALLGERLTMVARPEPPPWPYFMFGGTFGVGTALAIREDYLEWANSHAPEKHFQAVRSDFGATLVTEGARRGDTLSVSTGGIGWALSDAPPTFDPLPTLRIERMSKEEMEALRPGGEFHNGIGVPTGTDARQFRNHFAMVARDADDRLLAVAGVFDTSTMKEIGVDVAHDARGLGLARVVVTAAARAILEQGDVPYYACSDTNIRSQRTALACGFLPVCSTTSAFLSR